MKKVLSVFLVVVLIVTALPLTNFSLRASAETDGYYTYEVDNGEATVTRVSSYISGDITIPSTLGGYPVTSIADYAFDECSSLTSVTIGNSVTSIGDAAFYYCSSLTSVTIPNSVTSIGAGAFGGCNSLTSITIPFVGHSKDSISDSHFGYIFGASSYDYNSSSVPKSLNTVKITGGTSIGYRAFSDCSSLTSVTIPNSVTSIGYEAFCGCDGLTSVTIPNSVTSIGGYAFNNCSSLTSVTIPNSVTGIGNVAFAYCDSLIAINVDSENQSFSSQDGVLFDKNKTELICCPGGKSGEYVIPNSVTSIGVGAFYGCSSLTSVKIPNSVTSIGAGAFEYCSSLTSITIPNSVTSIGDEAFFDCSSLTSVKIPNSVTSIGNYAFGRCSSLTSVTIPNSVTSIGGAAFRDCSSLTSITIPDSVTSIGGTAFSGCSSLTSVTIGNSVTSIGVYAFSHCSSLTSVTIPNSVTSIGNGAFSDCSSLTSVTIGDSVTSIGDDVFSGCYNLTIYGCSGSVAETYAKENEIKFVPIADEDCSHKNTTVHPAKASTCKVQGNGKYTTCNDCGKVISGSNKKLPLAGHKYTTKTTKATLTKNGSIIKKCSVCGKVASTTVIYYPKTVSIAATTYTYTGKVITPAITVKGSNGKALKNGTDYTVSYASGRKNVGKYKVTVTFKGNYSGTKTFYFTINPVKTTVSKLTAGKKSIKVAISKKSTQVTGYQIQYSTSKTFKSAKTATVKSYKTTSVNLTKLSAKKTYYVRVRTYKTVGKTKYYSAWSTYKKSKTK